MCCRAVCCRVVCCRVVCALCAFRVARESVTYGPAPSDPWLVMAHRPCGAPCGLFPFAFVFLFLVPPASRASADVPPFPTFTLQRGYLSPGFLLCSACGTSRIALSFRTESCFERRVVRGGFPPFIFLATATCSNRVERKNTTRNRPGYTRALCHQHGCAPTRVRSPPLTTTGC